MTTANAHRQTHHGTIRSRGTSTADMGGLLADPYAFPYFHSDGSCPVLYRLILEVEALRRRRQPSASATAAAEAASERRDLLRRIKSRCIVKPAEVKWVDSCGENALHRLCQGARFGLATTTSTTASSSNKIDDNGNSSNDDDVMAIVAAQCLIDAAPGAAQAVNSWGETALHLFASHCGLDGDSLGGRSYRRAAAAAPNPTIAAPNADCDADGVDERTKTSNLGKQSPVAAAAAGGGAAPAPAPAPAPSTLTSASDRMLSLLLASSPTSPSIPNYLLGLPLHEACTLSSGPDVMLRTIDRAVADVMSDRTMHDQFEAMDNQQQHQQQHNQQHVKAVSTLLSHHPSALFVTDKNGRTPLFRAVESDRTSADVVRTILEGVENHCRNVGFNGEETREVVRSLVLGEGRRRRRRAVDCSEESSEPCIWPGRSAPTPDDRHHRSPLAHVWNEWVWTPRSSVPPPSSAAATHSATHAAAAAPTPPSAPSRTTLSTLVHTVLERARQKEDGDSQHDRAQRIVSQLGPLWDKAVLLIQAAHWGTVRDDLDVPIVGAERPPERRRGKFRLVHSAVLTSCPPSMVVLASHLYPEQLTERDEDGMTPLLLAAASVPPRGRGGGKSSRRRCPPTQGGGGIDGYNEVEGSPPAGGGRSPTTTGHGSNDRGLGWNDQSKILRSFVRTNGHACRMADRRGRLPMHVAVEAGYGWDDGLGDVLAAEPRSVRARDPVTGLVPFMLAAISRTASANNGGDVDNDLVGSTSNCGEGAGDDAKLTNTIFQLLRADPSVLGH